MSTSISERRLGTGLTNELLGTLCFLAAEGMFFLGLVFVALKIRRDAVVWPEGPSALAPELLLGNTALLLVSSLALHLAVRAVRRGDHRTFRSLLALTTGLGALFLVGQAYEFMQLGGWRPWAGADRAVFDTLVGLHGAHVVAGVGLLAVVLGRAVGGQFTAQRHALVSMAELYWHFVTAAWLTLLAVLLVL